MVHQIGINSHPDQTVVKLFAYSKAGLCASTITELELDIDVEILQIMLILSYYWYCNFTPLIIDIDIAKDGFPISLLILILHEPKFRY